MGKVVVVYTGESGIIKTYAEWIADELKIACLELDNYRLNPADTVIYGGWIFGGTIVDLSYLKDKIKDLIVFAVGSSPLSDAVKERISDKNNLGDLPFFYMEGDIRFDHLRSLKNMAYEYSRVEAEKKHDKSIIEACLREINCTKENDSDRQQIYALVNYIKRHYGCNIN